MDFDPFDARHYPTVPVREGYRDWVPSYEDTVEDRMDLDLLERIACIRWDEVTRAADLGCGTGRTGQWLSSRGASRVDGVDITPEMLEVARARDVYDQLRVADVESTGLDAGAYDLVVTCLVDEHLRELSGMYAEAARLLSDGGNFVLVGYHPFFMMHAGMPTHFDHPERGPVAVETYVHLFSDHVTAARLAGLGAEELHESLVDDEWVRMKPRWEAHRNWPVSFAWVWRVDGEKTP